MDTSALFESWRDLGGKRNEFGLAWFLANQFCRRYYSSHGIAPHVILHEGLGYYGIQLDYLHCKVNGEAQKPLGRFTMMGDVENWLTGCAGDHALNTSKQFQDGVPTEQLLVQAISHMRIPAFPSQSHLNCRHKRWGRSYELVFEIATILSLRCTENLNIWNHPDHVQRVLQEVDPRVDMQEHLGCFVFLNDDNRVVVAGDGRLLDGSKRNLWEDYMRGISPFSLAMVIESELNLVSTYQ